MTMRRRIGRAVSPAALQLLRLHTKLTGQQRTRVLVRNLQGEILLVWPTVGHGYWSLPGGGIKRNEPPAVAAARELHEETGIRLAAAALRQVAFVPGHDSGMGFDAYLLTGTARRDELPASLHNPLEIVDVAWFRIDALPEPRSPFVGLAIQELSKRP